jgi:hypothetical protein
VGNIKSVAYGQIDASNQTHSIGPVATMLHCMADIRFEQKLQSSGITLIKMSASRIPGLSIVIFACAHRE